MSRWWENAVFYQIYPRSYRDTDGDGVGDLRGVLEKLDHLSWLGIDGIWLNPITPSPNDDWGYDVSDYTNVHPELGTLQDLDDLVEAAGTRGVKIILDLVPNHTSSRHPWFRDALTGRDAPHRDWYVWADPAVDGGPPNNWLSVFGKGPAWTLHEETGQYYLHNFLATQPDLNWWNSGVRDAFDEILRFWFDRGISGFRIDVAHAIVNDKELRDNLPSDESDHSEIRRLGQKQIYNMNRPEVHDVLQRWRKLAAAYEPERALIGETYVLEIEQLMRFYGTGTDQLHLAFNFPFVFTDLGPAMIDVVEESLRSLPGEAHPVWMGSNHDVGRFPTRWAEGDDPKTRLALMMLLTLPGTCFLYYGDEIGMQTVDVPKESLLDPVAQMFWPADRGRDGARTPMRWNSDEAGGFTTVGTEPWLPFGDTDAANVTDQRPRGDSILHLCRDLIRFRSELPTGLDVYRRLKSPEGIWLSARGSDVLVALNLTDSDMEVEVGSARVLLSTSRERDHQAITGRCSIRSWEGLLLRRER